MNEIGGYFELELNSNSEVYHVGAIPLNTGRNALEYVLRVNNFDKIYIPYFTCEVLLEPINKLNLPFSYYSIDENLEPLFDYKKLGKKDAFLYTNYFGLKSVYIQFISSFMDNLIIDNAQAFFDKPYNNKITLYSARKFFGVADGAFLYSDKLLNLNLEQDLTYNRMSHLLIRKDQSAETGYSDFLNNDNLLINNGIKYMSKLTSAILNSIDYNYVAEKRIQNYKYLDCELKGSNKLNLALDPQSVPMVYPYWTNDCSLRNRLLENRIYCAQYWPNVKSWCEPESLEYKLTDEVIYLPIDQRYGESELIDVMKIIVKKDGTL